jgi:flagellar motor switch protein FliN/FliY
MPTAKNNTKEIQVAEAAKAQPQMAATAEMEASEAWPLISRLLVRLAAQIPLTGFKVRDLLALNAGQMIQSSWPGTEDVPVKAGEVHLSWSEFEVVEERMAVRLTRLA